MKLSTLYSRSGPRRKMLAQHINIAKQRSGKMDDGTPFIAAQTTSRMRLDGDDNLVFVPVSQRITYVTVVTFVRNMQAICSCSCPDFQYMWEAQLHHRWNAANIEYSDGSIPEIKNPEMKAGMCKHLCALYLRIKHINGI